jgi:hypothetical protein
MIYFVSAAVPVLFIGCVIAAGAWRGDRRWLDARNRNPFAGPERPQDDAYSAASVYGVFGFTLFALAGVVIMWGDRLGGSVRRFADVVAPVLLAGAFVGGVLAAWVFTFMVPSWLVPPPLRGRPGYFAVRRRRRRSKPGK